MVSAHLRFKGEGTATNGDAYKLSFIANFNFDAVSTFYDLPFHAVYVGKGKAPNFSATGTVRVFVNGAGLPTGATITGFSSTCTQYKLPSHGSRRARKACVFASGRVVRSAFASARTDREQNAGGDFHSRISATR